MGEPEAAPAEAPSDNQMGLGELATGDAAGMNSIGTAVRDLFSRYGIPPFSTLDFEPLVMDRRAGWWREQVREWKGLGSQSELGREGEAAGAFSAMGSITKKGQVVPGLGRVDQFKGMSGVTQEVSIFDPALCEVAYHWWCPPKGQILDPFAGGSVRGIVAGYRGHPYVGIDLNPAQVKANEEQAERIIGAGPKEAVQPLWLNGDSLTELQNADLIGTKFDFMWSCPPYGDLEVYTDDPRDLSRMSAQGFRDTYEEIIKLACARLKDNTFAGWVVGNYRSSDGTLRDLVGETVRSFRAAGMRYYNDAIILDPIGTAAIRARRTFSGKRKLVRAHQHLLLFVKGDAGKAADKCIREDERKAAEEADA